MALRWKFSPVSGNINGVTAGTVTPGNALQVSALLGAIARISGLCAIVNVTAATSTLTWTGHWQISNDGSTWVDVKSSNNAAYVVISTGTASATGDIAYEAPLAVYGARFARYVLVNGVATGGATDLYAISYSYNP